MVLRSNIQKQLFQLGCVIQKHAGKVLLFGVLILSILFGLGLNRGHIENRLEKLWVQGKKLSLVFYNPNDMQCTASNKLTLKTNIGGNHH